MKGIIAWFLKKVHGIDLDDLQDDNKKLKEENSSLYFHNATLIKDKNLV